MTHCSEHLQVKLFEQKVALCDTLTQRSLHREMGFFLSVFLFYIGFCLFSLGGEVPSVEGGYGGMGR